MNKVLAQDEVDALLRGLSGGEIENEPEVPEDDSGIVAFDLANQDRIIRGRMPVLEIVNDRFARLCTNALSNAVRKRVELNPISIDMTKFGEFMRSLPVPTSINIFKMDPLRGNAIMVVDSRLVFALVENVFGGAGTQPKIEGREFTRIEQAVVDKIVKIALDNMEESWRPVHDVKLELVRSEINPQFAAIVPPSDVVVVITFEVELDTALGSMIICLPYATIEPIRSKLHGQLPDRTPGSGPRLGGAPQGAALGNPGGTQSALRQHHHHRQSAPAHAGGRRAGAGHRRGGPAHLHCGRCGQIPGHRGHGQSHEGLSDHQGKRAAVYIKMAFPAERARLPEPPPAPRHLNWPERIINLIRLI